MGWGEAHATGNGTTGQVEEAHRALDALGVAPGPLALRTIALTAQLHDAADEVVRLRAVLDGLKVRVDRLETSAAPVACGMTEVVDGAAPNAVWCSSHHAFHPYLYLSAPADTGAAG